jgi:pyruvate,water dikinase
VIGIDRIKWFKEISKNDIASVGGKGANLGEMFNMDLPIPPGFFVTAQTYKEFIEKTGIVHEIRRLLTKLDVENTTVLQDRANQIQKLIVTTPVTPEIRDEVLDAYSALNTDTIFSKGKDIFVAVRSSATAEDLPEASFAGQQATYLNVRGPDQLIKAIRMCWASLFTARAIYYRTKNNFDHMKVYICVVVQKMVNADQAGILFSVNPATNDRSEIVIEAVHGLGETAVSGEVNPDIYIIDKEEMIIKSRLLKMQNWGLFRDQEGRNVKRSIPENIDKQQVIPDDVVMQLAKYSKQLEDHYGKPQDSEWAVEQGTVYIVQTRAVTTLKNKATTAEVAGAAIVKGETACAGVASGPVKIIRSSDDLNKIVDGDVMVTPMTNPDMVIAMKKAAAIVTDEGGITSHAAIVSREMGIPCIVGTENATQILTDGTIVTVDATHGKVVFGRAVSQHVTREIKPKIATKTQLKCILDLSDYAGEAAKTGADGIGLFRLELLIAENGIHPAEYIRKNKDDEYTNMLVMRLKKVGDAFKGKPVWVRTSDLRTDEYRMLRGGEQEPHETDPMIGWHGVRRGLDEPRIMKAEFNAIKRLHELGYKNFGIMIPFVIRAEEVRKAKDIMRSLGVEPVEDIPFGIMVETPAACWVIEDICKEGISFVSFGTNDLTQLTLGIDRNNEKIAKLFDEMHPAVLGEIVGVVNMCKKYGVETSLCGQAGSRPEMAKFLVMIGIDSIAVNRDALYTISETVKKVEEELGK